MTTKIIRKGKTLGSGGPGFLGGKGTSKTLMAGSRSGGKKLSKTSPGAKPFGGKLTSGQRRRSR